MSTVPSLRSPLRSFLHCTLLCAVFWSILLLKDFDTTLGAPPVDGFNLRGREGDLPSVRSLSNSSSRSYLPHANRKLSSLCGPKGALQVSQFSAVVSPAPVSVTFTLKTPGVASSFIAIVTATTTFPLTIAFNVYAAADPKCVNWQLLTFLPASPYTITTTGAVTFTFQSSSTPTPPGKTGPASPTSYNCYKWQEVGASTVLPPINWQESLLCQA